MATLYDLTETYNDFLLRMVGDDEDFDATAFQITLEMLEDDIDGKLEALAIVYKDLMSDASAIDDEMKALKQRSDAKKRRAEWVKDYLILNMTKLGKSKFETSKAVISLPKPKPSVEVDAEHFIKWASENRDDLLRYKAPDPDKTKIKEALLNGDEIVGAGLVYKHTINIK